MDLNELLKQSAEKRASDVHLKVGVPPVLRIDGHLTALQEAGRLSREWMVTPPTLRAATPVEAVTR